MKQIVADGGCACGAVRYSIKGELKWAGYCHCEACRRHSSSPFTAFFCVNESDMMFMGESLNTYTSSSGVERGFCKECGSHMSYASSKRAGEIDLYIASLDFPERIQPTSHYHWNERLPWLEIHDDLEKISDEET